VRLVRILGGLALALPAMGEAGEPFSLLGIQAGKNGASLSVPMQIVILLTLMTVLPAAVMSITPFLRIVVVLHFLRQALGTQSTPSNQVLVGLALPFAGWSWVAWGALILTLIGRLMLVGQVDRAFSLPRSAAWWVVARDLLSFGLFAASFLGREVAWRRHRFTLRPDGALAHDGDVRR